MNLFSDLPLSDRIKLAREYVKTDQERTEEQEEEYIWKLEQSFK